MGIKLRSKLMLLFMALAMMLAMPAIAIADNVKNDVVAEGNGTITAGGTSTVNYYIQDTGQTCDASDGSSVTVKINTPTGVSANPNSLSFNSCGELNKKPVQFSSNTPGTYNITVTTSDTVGTYNPAPAAFTLTVNAPAAPADTTPPVITKVVTGTLGNNGWYTSNVGVDWTVTDNESTISSQSGCDDFSVTSDQNQKTYTCSATSAGGTTTDSVTIKRDATAPVISGADVNDTTWRNSNLSQNFTASDATSGLSNSADGSFTLTASDESANANTPTTVFKTVEDAAGNSATRSLSALIDKTAPTIQGAASPGANLFGWNNSSVTVNYSCGDNLSGMASCGPNETLSSEGANQSSTGNATDNAGNSASDTVSGINIDKTNPLVSLVGGPANGSSHYFGSVPNAPTCDASDVLSGLNGACQVSGYGTTVGSHTVKATANDKAGNSNSASNSYTVDPWTFKGFYQPVDMNNVLNTVKGGSTVPLKFELFAGNTELTDTANVVTPLRATKVNCDTGSTQDEIEMVASGSTALRYDGTAGQYIYNWKTPTGAGTCYNVTITANDGSSQTAKFKLK